MKKMRICRVNDGGKVVGYGIQFYSQYDKEWKGDGLFYITDNSSKCTPMHIVSDTISSDLVEKIGHYLNLDYKLIGYSLYNIYEQDFWSCKE